MTKKLAQERQVAGLWCHEVLSDLSDFLDGQLSELRRRQLQEHVQGCDVCEKFGGEMHSVISALRNWEPEKAKSSRMDALRSRLLASNFTEE